VLILNWCKHYLNELSSYVNLMFRIVLGVRGTPFHCLRQVLLQVHCQFSRLTGYPEENKNVGFAFLTFIPMVSYRQHYLEINIATARILANVGFTISVSRLGVTMNARSTSNYYPCHKLRQHGTINDK